MAGLACGLMKYLRFKKKKKKGISIFEEERFNLQLVNIAASPL